MFSRGIWAPEAWDQRRAEYSGNQLMATEDWLATCSSPRSPGWEAMGSPGQPPQRLSDGKAHAQAGLITITSDQEEPET